MKLWIGGELVAADIADAFREARQEVEHALNNVFAKREYGPGLSDWAFIAMIYSAFDDFYPEVRKYRRSKSSCEFRLRIDHSQFARGDASARAGLICNALLDCLADLRSRGAEVDIDAVKADCINVARERGWKLDRPTPLTF
ncbi:MAG: hypothetical protein HY296_04905 [Thaumarchaeota archaeon]|nr:hypothetical protein [Nitrososphaerota archaeon]